MPRPGRVLGERRRERGGIVGSCRVGMMMPALRANFADVCANFSDVCAPSVFRLSPSRKVNEIDNRGTVCGRVEGVD